MEGGGLHIRDLRPVRGPESCGRFAEWQVRRSRLINKLFDSLMIPGVAEIQIDGRKTTGFLGDVYYFPFFVYGV